MLSCSNLNFYNEIDFPGWIYQKRQNDSNPGMGKMYKIGGAYLENKNNKTQKSETPLCFFPIIDHDEFLETMSSMSLNVTLIYLFWISFSIFTLSVSIE